VYVASLVTRPPERTVTTHDIVVSVSKDSGLTWQPPVIVESQPGPAVVPDKEAILADPRRPGFAYLVWAEYGRTGSSDPSVDQVFFSRSTDGGQTWSDIHTGTNGGGPHADHHGFGFDAADHLLDGKDGGIWRLDNSASGLHRLVRPQRQSSDYAIHRRVAGLDESQQRLRGQPG